MVGFTGVITCAALLGIATYSEKHFGSAVGWPDPPIVGLFAILAYGIGANVCYALGWMTELFARCARGALAYFPRYFGGMNSVILTIKKEPNQAWQPPTALGCG